MDEEDWSAVERALLDAALEFYGAAGTVIDYSGPDRPQLRRDISGLKAVRDAMAVLEDRICAADASGVSPERIASITRLEEEIVVLIVARRRTPARDAAES